MTLYLLISCYLGLETDEQAQLLESSEYSQIGQPLGSHWCWGCYNPGLLCLHSHLLLPYPTAFAFFFWSIWLDDISPWPDGFFHVSPMLLIELLSGKFYSALRPAGDVFLVAKGSWDPFFKPSLVVFPLFFDIFLSFPSPLVSIMDLTDFMTFWESLNFFMGMGSEILSLTLLGEGMAKSHFTNPKCHAMPLSSLLL